MHLSYRESVTVYVSTQNPLTQRKRFFIRKPALVEGCLP